MPITIKISGEIFHIPLFSELTIKHLIDLRKISSVKPLELMIWAFGKEPELNDSKTSKTEVTNAINLIHNLIEEITAWLESGECLLAPESVEIMGVKVVIKPDMIYNLPWWGSERTRSVISQVKDNDYTDFIPEVIAHYLYSIVTKSNYDEDKADDFIDIINEMKLTEAVRLGNFFLLKQLKYSRRSKRFWLTILMKMKYKLALMFSRSTEQLIH